MPVVGKIEQLEQPVSKDLSQGHEHLIPKLRQAIAQNLAPQVTSIDLKGEYPTQFMFEIGKLGAYSQAVTSECGGVGSGLQSALRAIEAVSETCMSTGFMVWCHNACAWYIQNSNNDYLKTQILPQVAQGKVLCGTGLSNPMKHFAGIEKIAIAAKRCEGGYILNGMLPWVSNIDVDHYWAIAAKVEGGEDYLMGVVSGNLKGLTLRQNAHFIALEGTKTYSCVFRDVFLQDQWVLAAPCENYVEKIKPGFILTQVGMGLGVISSCIDLIKKTNVNKSHVNCYLEDGAEELEEELDALRMKSYLLAEIIHCGGRIFSKDILKGVIECRVASSELSLRASQSAMLHAGARGYIHGSEFERKLRESYFVAIVTPALKHLKKMLYKMQFNS
ncbi:acyl-CoA dehydrogenase [Synechococcus sp. PCC 7502]|uniref:acyl-CoA dehydrogenase family protein n=1 Tax=Synechococcus sp. PCC 7502 TaxID=1173263 RepID=UPI00029F8364|nr:acyl-CoA dehydrogenase family protein [Synechococcus sp. PCC 7502]AFY73794.1 acyl-CoA dehydrogenase [Synechococcus sp. PCC 7502]